MAVNELIEQVKGIIGNEHKNDWKIAPTDHAKAYKETAPALAAILEDPVVEIAARRYEEDDNDANDAQKEFKQATKRANQFVLATACLGAILLTVGLFIVVDAETSTWDIERIIFMALGVLSILLVIFSQRWLLLLRQGDLLKVWMTNRAQAETNRVEYFKAVIDLEPPLASATIPIDLLKLEYVRRYLLNSQIKYFQKRGREHSHASKKTLNRSSWAITLGTGMMALSGFLATYDSRFAALAAIGTIATAVAAFLTIWESINQDQSNAERYRNTQRSLEDLLLHLRDVRKLAAAGNTNAVSAFFDSANDILTEEHRQWLADIEKRNLAVARLEQTLKDLESEQVLPEQLAPVADAEVIEPNDSGDVDGGGEQTDG